MPQDIKYKIIAKLKEKLDVIEINLKDESSLHINHNIDARSGNTHFSLFIVAEDFAKMNLVSRHRLVNQILKCEYGLIHALRISALNREEYLHASKGKEVS
ncbi:MAG: BolA protein [Candidatus Midichloriaceae bacterium]|jgi:BolA protein